MRNSWIGVILLASWGVLGTACAAAQETSVIYMNDPLHWKETPRPDRSPARSALLMIVVLDPDGSLAIFGGFGEESGQDSKLRILYTEGYAVSTGTWTMANGTLIVQASTIFSYAQPYPPARSEMWKYTGSQSGLPLTIDTGRTRLVRTQSLEDVDELVRIIDWRKSQVDEP